MEEGSITAVLGPSGSGKTTILRLVAGFERPDAGTISVGGTLVAGDGTFVAPSTAGWASSPRRAPCSPTSPWRRTSASGSPGARARSGRIAECLALTGLEGFEGRHPHQLSGGQQQRVALARALAPHPSLILLDEPFSALDAALRPQVRADVVAALRADGATAVVVTHDRDEALAMADQVVVLIDGRVEQAADPATLYRSPATEQVADVHRRRPGGEPGSGRATASAPPLGDFPVDRASRAPDGEVDVVLRPDPVLVYPPVDSAG